MSLTTIILISCATPNYICPPPPEPNFLYFGDTIQHYRTNILEDSCTIVLSAIGYCTPIDRRYALEVGITAKYDSKIKNIHFIPENIQVFFQGKQLTKRDVFYNQSPLTQNSNLYSATFCYFEPVKPQLTPEQLNFPHKIMFRLDEFVLYGNKFIKIDSVIAEDEKYHYAVQNRNS